jgi:pyridoxamine 5'-phosphate oxidase
MRPADPADPADLAGSAHPEPSSASAASPDALFESIERASDPIAVFRSVFERARTGAPFDPTAMTLATADGSGRVAARIVLLKEVDARGFVFYTNRASRKGRDLEANPHAAIVLHWPHVGEQVRVEGAVERVTDAESDAYFATRPRESQLGAWASEQSAELASREALLERVRALEAQYRGIAVPRPPHWGGYRVVPARIEFWKEGPFRLHDRFVFERASDDVTAWRVTRLSP